MAQELQIMLGVIVELLREEEEEMELVDELANPNVLEDLVVNRHIRLDPTTFVAITDYVQNTVNRYPDYLFKQHFRMSRNAFEVTIET